MQRKPWPIRIALWAAVCVVLLKSAMPLLAAVSAQQQGKSLVEVCTVYGVATVVLDDNGQGAPAPASEHGAVHAGDQCALTALTAFAAFEPPVLGLQDVLRATSPPRHQALPSLGPDACASWAARLQHGPPYFA